MSASVPSVAIRARRARDDSWVAEWVRQYFGSPRVVSRGILHDVRSLHGLVAERDGASVGLLLYAIRETQCEVVVLIASRRREGVGRRLLDAMRPIAEAENCRRLWLITTANNRGAREFYRAVGWSQVAIHRGAMREARRLKPELPEFDAEGIPIEDEVEFELILSPTP